MAFNRYSVSMTIKLGLGALAFNINAALIPRTVPIASDQNSTLSVFHVCFQKPTISRISCIEITAFDQLHPIYLRLRQVLLVLRQTNAYMQP